MALLTTSEKFARSYDERGLQPFSGTRGAQPMQKSSSNGVRNVEIKGRVKGATRQITGNTVRAAGVGMQAVGKGARRVGQTTTKAGTRLTATGIGAIVGVPLLAVGGAATVGGAGMDVAGKQVSRAGKRMTKKNNKALAARGVVKGFSIHVRAAMTGFYFAWPIAICWFLEICFFIIAVGVGAILKTEAEEGDGLVEGAWKFLVSGVKIVFESADAALEYLTGGAINLDVLIGAVNPANYFALFYIATLGFSIMTIMSVWFVYEIGGAKPLSGKGGGGKQSAFLLMLCLYCLPIVHVFPWFLVWSYAILRNDK